MSIDVHSVECVVIALTELIFDEGCLKELFVQHVKKSLSVQDACELCSFVIFGNDKLRYLTESTFRAALHRSSPVSLQSKAEGEAFISRHSDSILKLNGSCICGINAFGRCINVKPKSYLSRGEVIISELPYIITSSKTCRCCFSPILMEHILLARVLSIAAIETGSHAFNMDLYHNFLHNFKSNLPSSINYSIFDEHTGDEYWSNDVIIKMILLCVLSSLIPTKLHHSHEENTVTLISDPNNTSSSQGSSSTSSDMNSHLNVTLSY